MSERGNGARPAVADVIVAGSGHNGLVAACYLARTGLDVLVVEAHSTPGGMTATNEMTPEAPGHIINEASIHASLFNTTTIDSDLGLSARFGLRARPIDPAHVHLGPEGESLAMWRDHAKTAAEMRRFSQKDARAYLELTEVIDHAVAMGVPMMQTDPVRPDPREMLRTATAVLHGRKRLPEILRWVASSQAEVLEGTFEHQMSRAQFPTQLPFMRFTDDLSGWALIYLGIYAKWGVKMFEGGTGSLPKALIACLESHGGRVRCAAPVEQILVTGGRATGVRLQGGEELTARRAVVTAFSPKAVLGRLLPEGTLPPEWTARVKHIPTRGRGVADYKLNVAVKGKLTMTRHERWRGDGLDLRVPCTTWNTYDEVIDAWEAARRGDVPDMIPGLSSLTTAFDPSMAPEGHDTFWFWTGVTPSDPREGWDVARDQIADQIVKNASQYFDGLEELEIGRRPLGLPDIEERFWALDGSVYHTDPLITRFGPLKPAIGLGGYTTPVAGLYLSGSGTHPVAGISGLPGRNTANAVLRTLKHEEGRTGRLQVQRAVERSIARLTDREKVSA